jgi:hypothetical protein
MAPPPFRAEHMGSLLRPQDLLDAREAIREKGISEEQAGLPAIEKKAVEDVVKLQTELGLKAVTSGEFNRTRFWGLMWDEFDGTLRLQDAEASMFRLYHPDVVSLIEKDRKVMPGDSVIAGSKLSHNTERSVSNLHELKLVQAALPQSEWKNIKLTMITPGKYKQAPVSTSLVSRDTLLTFILTAQHGSTCATSRTELTPRRLMPTTPTTSRMLPRSTRLSWTCSTRQG